MILYGCAATSTVSLSVPLLIRLPDMDKENRNEII